MRKIKNHVLEIDVDLFDLKIWKQLVEDGTLFVFEYLLYGPQVRNV